MPGRYRRDCRDSPQGLGPARRPADSDIRHRVDQNTAHAVRQAVSTTLVRPDEVAEHDVAVGDRVDDLDAVLLQLVAERGKLFLFDLVVDGKGLQGRLVDGAQRLGLVRERARIKFSQIDQFRYFLSIRRGWGALARETKPNGPV